MPGHGARPLPAAVCLDSTAEPLPSLRYGGAQLSLASLVRRLGVVGARLAHPRRKHLVPPVAKRLETKGKEISLMGLNRLSVLAALIPLVGASTAHAGKRLTTGASGVSHSVECTVVNASETKTIGVRVNARTVNSVLATQDFVIPPLASRLVSAAGGDRWCEFIVLEGGSARDLRASMLVLVGGSVTAIDPAREK
jgi:hypothetical protein